MKTTSTLRVRGVPVGGSAPVELLIEKGVVRKCAKPPRNAVPDLGDGETLLAPVLFDFQVNGAFGIDLQRDGFSVDDVVALSGKLAARGVGAWLPTLITSPVDSMARRARVIAQAAPLCRRRGAAVAGIHYEGPFISPEDGPRGAHPKAHVLAPNPKALKTLLDAAGRLPVCMTLAPELDGAVGAIKTLAKRPRTVAALGHHGANAEQINAAADAGARLCTHLGNGIATTLHRHNNPIWPQLADTRLHVSLIADMHHLPPAALTAIIRAKGADRVVLISDAVSLAGMPPGHYDLFGAPVEKRADNKVCLSGTELLAGSGSLLFDCVINAANHGGMTLPEAFAAASANPARLLGLPRPAWPPATGKRAGFVAFKKTGRGARASAELLFCFINGNLYRNTGD